MSHIYLTGDVVESSDLSGLVDNPELDWRTSAMTKLQRYGMQVVNPILGAWDSDDGLERRVRRALDLIDQADAVLANLRAPGYGTPMEIFYAHRRGKTVAVVGQSPFSPWVLSHSNARFDNMERAVDFIIEALPRPDLVNWCLQFEGQLAEHYEQLPMNGEPDYQFLGGDLPVLVMAPHATAYFDEGEFQEPEMFTGCMTASLHRNWRSHALLSYYCSVANPVAHVQTPMMRGLGEIAKAGQVGMIIVLSGAPRHESPGLAVEAAGPLGSAYEDYASRLRLKLSALEPVAATQGDAHMSPLMQFAAQTLNLPIMVLRTHRRYRMPRLQPEPFEQMLDLIGEFINEVGVELLRNRG
jgi:nucleoside 2-deoxyribosyltransferase